MRKFVFIGGDSRSGGSLLARLFDGVPGVGAYFFENEYFQGRSGDLISFDQFRETGNFRDIESQEVVAKIRKFAEGRLQSKARYGQADPQLDYEEFRRVLSHRLSGKKGLSDREIFQTIEDVFFEQTCGLRGLTCVANHNSRTFVADLEEFYQVFGDAYFVHMVRDPRAVYASMKRYQSAIAPDKKPPSMPPEFLDLAVCRWLFVLRYALSNKLRFGDRYIVLEYEKLVQAPGRIMRSLSRRMGMRFDQAMLIPTLGGTPWAGNSSFGELPATVSRRPLEQYKSVLNEDELSFIEKRLGPVIGYFETMAERDFLDEQELSGMKGIVVALTKKLCEPSDFENREAAREYYNQLFLRMRVLQIA